MVISTWTRDGHIHMKPKIISLSQKRPILQNPSFVEIKDDVSDFYRRLRLAEEFSEEDNGKSLVKHKKRISTLKS